MLRFGNDMLLKIGSIHFHFDRNTSSCCHRSNPFLGHCPFEFISERFSIMRSGFARHRQNRLAHRRSYHSLRNLDWCDDLLSRGSRFDSHSRRTRPFQGRFDPFDVRIRCRRRRSYADDRSRFAPCVERSPNRIGRMDCDESPNIVESNEANSDRRISECRYRYRQINSDTCHLVTSRILRPNKCRSFDVLRLCRRIRGNRFRSSEIESLLSTNNRSPDPCNRESRTSTIESTKTGFLRSIV
jgi:hypothetical protein